MVNRTGKNGSGPSIVYPADDILQQTLMVYATRQYTIAKKLLRLQIDLNLDIKKTKLNELERKYLIPTVRRPRINEAILREAVVGEMNKDKQQGNGPLYIISKLKDKLLMVPRSIGPYHEVSADGHEKLGAQALQMGDIGLPIYGYKDKWSDIILKLCLVPDCQKAATVGHLFLDFVTESGGIPIQLTTDKGSEIGWQFAIQDGLRSIYAPDIDLEVYPTAVIVKSTHNIVIEAFWHWLRKKAGHNLKEIILRGKAEHIFQPNLEFHTSLFYWIFVPLIQAELNEFCVYWNQHRVRGQTEKVLPSGHVPIDVFEHPNLFGGLKCFIGVPDATITELCAYLEEEVGSREQHLAWYDADFNAWASNVYATIGSPGLNLRTAWNIFSNMSQTMQIQH